MEQIKLKLTENNNPYIEFPNFGHISFVNWSKTKEGYKHLNFSFRQHNNTSFLTDMNFSLYSGVDKKEIKRTGIMKIIKPLILVFGKLVKNDIFPYDKIDKLGVLISGITYEPVVKEQAPLRRRKKKFKEELEDENLEEEEKPKKKILAQKVTRKGNIKPKKKQSSKKVVKKTKRKGKK